ncbi:uncharacterized protein (TIGR00159 family) [Breznakibacter xylanolyticus]|uniref:Diadenylate cyclase n=1 Tax=Breznakibacter xylanolyticus TaxID=990 RepID=A0A2W7N7L2_9BACT|nr:diadenylate cyclase CdaA [Breznakibacter xylanolyticus]MBN2744095.1 diadenylate cyclase CdaA [Marinilabiliaceae bacterium]PZX16385.1 uncharacterized protein (TIGR00159 family) [Breznakibacter xylanolyticus]
MGFLEFRLIDLIDILLVAFLLYKTYRMVQGTIALNIFIGMFGFLILWVTIKALKMQLSSSILDNFVNVGVLALIVVFQQEIRRFFLHIGTKYKFTYSEGGKTRNTMVDPIVKACEDMSRSYTGALIVITRKAILQDYIDTGEKMQATPSARLIECLFFKNNPLHDGAIIISHNQIQAAACILPVSQNPNLPTQMGLRHRAAMGITESTDALAIVVSEEKGTISLFDKTNYKTHLTIEQLEEELLKM